MCETPLAEQPESSQRSVSGLAESDHAEDPIRVLVVDDHPAIREALRHTFDATPDICLCHAAASSAELLEAIDRHHPHVVVVDLQLQDEHGLSLIEEIRSGHPGIRTVVFSMRRERGYAELAIRSGASAFVSKQSDTRLLVEAVRRAYRGEIFLRKETALNLVSRMLNGEIGDPAARMDRLTSQERRVFEMMGEGHAIESIAEELGISDRTVAVYRRRIKEKLALSDIKELVQEACRWVDAQS